MNSRSDLCPDGGARASVHVRSWTRTRAARAHGLRAFLPVLVLALGVTPAVAQTLAIKPPAADPPPGECPAVPVATSRETVPPAVLDSLLNAGSRAAILGDHASAEELFRRAVTLDPSNAVASYRLARTLDDEGRLGDAALEYCRYLALAPTAADAAEIRGRARSLLTGEPAREPWKSEALAGVNAYAAGRHAEAVAAFSRALEHAPELPEAFYNRGLAHLAVGSNAEAAADLDAYLRLRPQAEDAARVRAQLDRLRAQMSTRVQSERAAAPASGAATPAAGEASSPPLRSPAPGSVLVQGLVVPGLGQHATGRTVWGVGVLAAVGGAVYLAMREETVVRRVTAQDPFGNAYEYDVRTLDRPYQALGIGAAVGIGVAAALESFLYALRRPALPAVASSSALAHEALTWISVTPTGDGVRLGLRLPAATNVTGPTPTGRMR